MRSRPLSREEVLGYVEGAIEDNDVWQISTDIIRPDLPDEAPTPERGRTVTLHLTPTPAPQATITLADGRNVTIDEAQVERFWKFGEASTLSASLRPLFTDTDEATP